MNRKSFVIGLALSCVIILGSGKADAREIPSGGPNATLLVTGLQGASGSTIGPGGALYVTEGAPAGSRASIRRPGRSRRSPAVCRPGDHRPHRRGDRRRVHRHDRVRAGHPRRP